MFKEQGASLDIVHELSMSVINMLKIKDKRDSLIGGS